MDYTLPRPLLEPLIIPRRHPHIIHRDRRKPPSSHGQHTRLPTRQMRRGRRKVVVHRRRGFRRQNTRTLWPGRAITGDWKPAAAGAV